MVSDQNPPAVNLLSVRAIHRDRSPPFPRRSRFVPALRSRGTINAPFEY